MSAFEEDPTDYRAHPERYRIGRGEQGVFHVQPYKRELLPLWTFRTPEAARASAEAIRARYDAYAAAGEFPGTDMARKYLQMGWTRAMRYAKYPGGRKMDAHGVPVEPQTWADPQKREAALIFKAHLDAVLADPLYRTRRAEHAAREAREASEA